MSDEPILEDLPTEDANRSPDEWVMPEPVFRTSDGYNPKNAKSEFDADDIPTEIANRDESAFAEPQSEVTDENAVSDEEVNTAEIVEGVSDPKPKRGSAKNFLFIVSLIGVAAVAIIIALIYLLFYYSPAETGTF